jgi:hypothetical protein
MAGKSSNKSLRKASQIKNDEFYTQLSDIEKELGHYKNHFNGKIIFCNCDDPTESNFWKYFQLKFEDLKLKKLVATHFEKEKPSYKLEMVEGRAGITKTELKQNGDFRSPECIEILREADIVVTNPPFSLFREYAAQLIEYNKKFIILGSLNALTYKEIFKLIKENTIWLGYSVRGKCIEFRVPQDHPLKKGLRIDANGNKFIKMGNIRWFTNLDYKKRHEDMILYETYYGHENKYPKYNNYDAINVDKAKEIPTDYRGVMGVPITFIEKYNPEQFGIVALGIVGSIDFTSNKKMEILDKRGDPTGRFTLNAKGTLYCSYNPDTDKNPAFKDCETEELYTSIYARILIKRIGVIK